MMGRPTSRWRVEELAVGDDPTGQERDDSFAGVVERDEQRTQLVEVRDARRDGAASVAVVGRRGARGEPHGTRRHGVGHHLLHAGQFLRRGGAFVGLFPHDVHPDGGVADVTAVVERRAASVDGVEILGEGLELVPGHARRQRVEAHVLHVLEGAGEKGDELGPDGCDGEATVPGDDARDPVERGGGEPGVPEHLGVVVGVDVDEPRGHDLTRGVELPVPAEAFPHADDAAFGHSDVGPTGGSSRPVDQRTSPNHDVAVHRRLLRSQFPGRRAATTPLHRRRRAVVVPGRGWDEPMASLSSPALARGGRRSRPDLRPDRGGWGALRCQGESAGSVNRFVPWWCGSSILTPAP